MAPVMGEVDGDILERTAFRSGQFNVFASPNPLTNCELIAVELVA